VGNCNIRGIVRAMLNVGSKKALEDALDCDAYTAAGDLRALDGLGWTPCTLTTEERVAIEARLAAMDAERRMGA